MNLQPTNRRKNATTSSGTTLHLAKTPAPTSDTSSLALIDKHFPKDHKLRKIFNRNTIKISYSCMNNAKQIIDNHNKQILKSYTQANDTATANPNTIQNKKTCRQKNTCPLEGKLPTIIGHLPSYSHTQRQQHNRNIHRTHRKQLQNKIPKPYRIIPPL